MEIPSLTAPGAASETAGKPPLSGTASLANQDMFLKLLVAQLQNQNPLSPSDPIQFVAQLAQFSTLEQTIAMRERLDDIYGALPQQTAGPAPSNQDTKQV